MRNVVSILAGSILALLSASQLSAQDTKCATNLDPNTSSGEELLQCLVQMQETINQLSAKVAQAPNLAEADVQNMIANSIEPFQSFASMKGAVIAFDRSEDRGGGIAGGACPIGWTLFRPAGGRFILGAGSHTNSDENGARLSDYGAFSDDPDDATGGIERYALTREEMPWHQHSMGVDLRGEGGGSGYSYVRPVGPNDGSGAPTVGMGGLQDQSTKAHQNMPPYIALYFCRKENE
ncbi:hypothetical protein IWQ51_006861 [Labrenzia sp. EL_142]|nr:hypothetical protein [Labrenzia sp. EL_142]